MALNMDIEEIYNANPEGCDKCNKGYHGRIAIQEVLMINDEIRNALNEEGLEKDDLNKLVYTSDVITMLQDGLLKVLNGSTSFDEIYRIIDVDDDLDVYSKIRGIEYKENNINNQQLLHDTDIKEDKNNATTPNIITIEEKQKEEEVL